ncbi:hypothetical protein QR680_003483 [Steinernema hermaphroditum]|uniref:Uncharacterized protein n=1 Tax=Steinernema hermaphroditum TaxID=289476 RepID=A0AA39HLJ5_9BILA|nr:hypothetical protein QR680_003483 [Steinernema hermaphroditum]
MNDSHSDIGADLTKSNRRLSKNDNTREFVANLQEKLADPESHVGIAGFNRILEMIFLLNFDYDCSTEPQENRTKRSPFALLGLAVKPLGLLYDAFVHNKFLGLREKVNRLKMDLNNIKWYTAELENYGRKIYRTIAGH